MAAEENSEAPSLKISSGTPYVENSNLKWEISPLDPIQSYSDLKATGQWEYLSTITA